MSSVRVAVKDLKQQIARKEVKFEEDAEPLEKFLITAISKSKSWEEIIRENRLDKIFSLDKTPWQVRDIWLLVLCLSNYAKEEGLVLAYRLLNKHRQATQSVFSAAKTWQYYQRK